MNLKKLFYVLLLKKIILVLAPLIRTQCSRLTTFTIILTSGKMDTNICWVKYKIQVFFSVLVLYFFLFNIWSNMYNDKNY